jgi:hypothetical protein
VAITIYVAIATDVPIEVTVTIAVAVAKGMGEIIKMPIINLGNYHISFLKSRY